MKKGELVRVYKHGAIGLVVELFDDLDSDDPWVRGAFTHPHPTTQWVKRSGLELIKEGGQNDPLLGAKMSGSL